MRIELSRPETGAASARASPPLPRIPELETDYELVRELGRGSTAVVYLARERALARYVAIKLIPPLHVQDEDAVVRLEREARTVARLQHPNVVMLLGARRLAQGGVALVLQYVPGSTLRRHLRKRGALPLGDVESVLHDVGRALDYVHDHGVVHRDVKPENIHLDGDARVARLSDFGIAQVADGASMTMAGTALGTPSYMSPEQVDGLDLDGRSDVYSLGLVGWEMVAGRHPWAGEPLYAVLHKQKHETPPPLASLRPDAPPSLRAAIEKAVAKDPRERWQSAGEFLVALRTGPVGVWQPTHPPQAADTEAPSATAPGDVEDAPTVRLARPPFGRDGAGAAARERPVSWEAPRVARKEPTGTRGRPSRNGALDGAPLEGRLGDGPHGEAPSAPGIQEPGAPPVAVPSWVFELDADVPPPPRLRSATIRGAERVRVLAGRAAEIADPLAARTARGLLGLAGAVYRTARDLAPRVLSALRELAHAFRDAGRAVFGTVPRLGELGQLALLVFALAALLSVLGRPAPGPTVGPLNATPAGAGGEGAAGQESAGPAGAPGAWWPQRSLSAEIRAHVVRSWYRVRASAREVARDVQSVANDLWNRFRRLVGPTPIRTGTSAPEHAPETVWAWQRA